MTTQKILKKMILKSEWNVEHPFTGHDTQHLFLSSAQIEVILFCNIVVTGPVETKKTFKRFPSRASLKSSDYYVARAREP